MRQRRPLLDALEQLLEGDGHKLLPIFQDKEANSFSSQEAHTPDPVGTRNDCMGPAYLLRASFILLKLSKIDPGGSLAIALQEPSAHISALASRTNAPLYSVLECWTNFLMRTKPCLKLLVELLPGKNDTVIWVRSPDTANLVLLSAKS